MFRGLTKSLILSERFLINNQDIRRSIYNSLCTNSSRNQEEIRCLLDKSTKKSKEKDLTKKFTHFFSCSEDQAATLVAKNKVLIKVPLDKICKNIEILYENKVSAESIMDNIWMVGVSENYLKEKIKLVEKLQPRDINDFLPLISVSPLILSRTLESMIKERNFVPQGNRIHYFSKRLGVKPSLISKYFSTNMYMFKIDFDRVVANLDVMLEFNVPSINILRDLWVFNYLPTTIRARLERCQQAEKENLKPWVIKCSEETLGRSLTLSQESKNLLGGSTVIDYLSERLGYNKETTKNIVSKHKQVSKVRVTRAKQILDYLLIEEKFEPFEIANVIRILCHSLKTTKERLLKLKEYGCRPTSLVIVCKSQKEFDKFFQNWIEHRTSKQGKNS